MMRIRNVAMPTIIGLVAAGALVVPVTASTAAPVTPAKTVSIASSAKLGLQGASVILTVNYSCPSVDTGPGVTGKVAQNIDGHQLARATGFVPGVCDGTTHTAQLLMDDNTIPFKKGEAAALATLGVDGPNAGVISISTGYVAVNLKK